MFPFFFYPGISQLTVPRDSSLRMRHKLAVAMIMIIAHVFCYRKLILWELFYYSVFMCQRRRMRQHITLSVNYISKLTLTFLRKMEKLQLDSNVVHPNPWFHSVRNQVFVISTLFFFIRAFAIQSSTKIWSIQALKTNYTRRKKCVQRVSTLCRQVFEILYII